MKFVDVLFSDFVPDRGGAPWPENPGYLIESENVRYTPTGYRCTYAEATAASSPATVGATALSAVGFSNGSSAPRHYVGSAAKLWESDDFGAVWNDNAGTAYTATDWDFALFDTTIIAANINNPIQEKDVSDPDTTNFADLGGSPPRATLVARVRDFLVIGNTSNSSWEIKWSAIGDPTNWPTPGSATALATQSGSEILPTEFGLPIQIIGGEKFGLILQEKAITRMTYIGGDVVFSFDTFDKEHGTGYKHTGIRVGGLFYFIAQSGVYRTDGYRVENISLGRIEDAIFRNLANHPTGASQFMYGVAYDQRLRRICWSFSVSGGADYLLCYYPEVDKFEIVNPTASIRDGTLYSVYDGLSTPIANSIPHFIDDNNKLFTLNDTTAIPTLMRTGYVELEPGYVTQITGIEVLGAEIPTAPTISAKSVSDAKDIDMLTTGYTAATKSSTGPQFAVRKSGRFHSFKYVDSAQNGDTLIRGLRVYYEVASQR